MKPITRNTLFYGDNLEVTRDHIPDESVDPTLWRFGNKNIHTLRI